MTHLKVKTRNDSTAQGKARIYISCHPDDFEPYFLNLCDDIFASQNCAIYYAADRDSDTETMNPEEYLSDMQLIVVPVTKKYLQDVGGTLADEYAYAMEHYIPVLPILMEVGALDRFAGCMNRIKSGYGDIQFLNRVSTDPTEIAYAEKLKARLNSILTADKLAERVRAAFDAYIFLSYRKKDRVHAKELMKLIHRIPYCQDIAIWYDEYLIPGERWNDSITAALAKSSLVTMAITPNIIEEGNFVIRNEYPDAVSLGKQVVPVEMKPTDRESLSSLFEGLSMPVNGHSLEDLTEALQSLAVETNDTSPDHQFLIGLAYLGGIDVEKDPDRAVKLITQSAEAGLPEAVKQLETMYENGNGVCRDYAAAIQWQKKYVDLLERSADPGFASELMELGTLQAVSGYRADQVETMIRLVNYSEANFAKEEKHSIVCICNLCRSYLELGFAYINAINVSNGMEKGHEYYRKAFQFIEAFAEDKEYGSEIDIRRCYAESCCKLAAAGREDLSMQQQFDMKVNNTSAAYRKQKWDFQKQYFTKAIKSCESIAEETTAEIDYLKLSKIYTDFMEFALMHNEKVLRRELAEKNVKLCEKLAGESDSYQARQTLGKCCCALAVLYEADDKQASREYFLKSVALQERIAEEDESAWNLELLARTYHEFAYYYEKENDLADSRIYLQKEADMREKICIMTGSVSSIYNLASSYWDRADNCVKLGELDNAKNNFDACLRLEEQAAARTNDPSYYRILARRYAETGETFRDLQDYESAIKYYRPCVEYNIQLVSKEKEQYEQTQSPTSESSYVAARWTLSDAYRTLGEIYQKAKDYSNAEKFLLKGQLEHEGIMSESINPDPYANAHADKRLSLRYCNMGDMCLEDNRPEDAEKYYRKSIEAAALIQPIFPNMDMSFLQEIRDKYAQLPKQIIDADPQRKKNLLKKLEETDTMFVIIKEYAETVIANGNKAPQGAYKDGVIAYAKGDFETAFQYFEKLEQIGAQRWLFHSGVMYRYGLGTEQDSDKALSLFEKFYAWPENAGKNKEMNKLAAQQCLSIVGEIAESKGQSEADALFDHGNMLFKQEVYPLALSFFKKSADEGRAEAMYQCGMIYLEGKGTKINIELSLEYFNNADKAGFKQSKTQIAYIEKNMKELLKIQEEETEAMHILDKEYDRLINGTEKKGGADRAIMGAIYKEGISAYMEGYYETAVSKFEELTKMGMLQAMFNCGVMYRYGLGGPKDLDKALDSFESFILRLNNTPYFDKKVEDMAVQQCISIVSEQAENKGEDKGAALFDYGNRFYKHEYYDFARECFMESAENGCPEAMYNCGIIYLQAKGVRADYDLSLDYLNRAYEAGVNQAKEAIDYLKKNMRKLKRIQKKEDKHLF